MSEFGDTDLATALDVDSQNCSTYLWKSEVPFLAYFLKDIEGLIR